MRRRMLIFVATMMVTVSALAQKLNVRGTVIDENKEAVIGASVLIKGSNIGTKTDIYGQFLLDGVKSGSELVISYVGMKTKTVQARSSLSIVLEKDDQGFLLGLLPVRFDPHDRKHGPTSGIPDAASVSDQLRRFCNARRSGYRSGCQLADPQAG